MLVKRRSPFGGSTIAWAILIAALPRIALAVDTSTDSPIAGPGLIVEDVRPGNPLEKAGLLPGDLLISWNVPGSADAKISAGSSGSVDSPFVWSLLTEELAPAKAIELEVAREGAAIRMTVEPGRWQASIRPHWTGLFLEEYLRGNEKTLEGDLEEGLQDWQQMVADLVRSKNSELACWLSIKIASAWRKGLQPQRSMSALQNVELRSASPSCQIEIHRGLGLTFESLGELEKARGELQVSLDLEERVRGRSLAWAARKSLLGSLAWKQRQLDEAQKHLLEALQIQEELAPQSFQLIPTLANLGSVSSFQNYFDTGANYSLRALELVEQKYPDDPLLPTILNTLANARLNLGYIEEARSLFLRALRLIEGNPSKRLLEAKLMNNLGALAFGQGKLEDAAGFYRKALEMVEQQEPESLDIPLVLSNLGNTFLFRGEVDLARDYYQRALDMRKRLAPESLDTAITLTNLGTTASIAGDSTLAERYQREALEIQERLVPGSLYVARSLGNLGHRAREKKDLDRARRLYQRSMEIFLQQAPYSAEAAGAQAELGSVLNSLQETEESRAWFERARDLIEKVAPDSERAAQIYAEMALAFVATDRSKALELFGLSVDRLDHLLEGRAHLQAYREMFGREHERVYKTYMDLLLEAGRPEEALAVLERYRARKYLALLGQRELLLTAGAPEELRSKQRRLGAEYDKLQHRLASIKPEGDPARAEELVRTLRELRFQQAVISAEIRGATPGAEIQSPILDLKRVRRTLEGETALLSYSLGREISYLFILPATGRLQVIRLEMNERDLREKVRLFLELVPSARTGMRREALIALGRELYDLLLAPAERYIATSRRLLIIPDGILHVLPWSALVRKGRHETGSVLEEQFLVEWKPIHLTLSATAYAQSAAGDLPLHSNGGIAIFGDPLFPRSESIDRKEEGIAAAVRRGLDLSPLPASRGEAERITSLFSGVARSFLGAEAREDKVKALPRDTRIVHFATHATLAEGSPLDSAVVLSIPEKPEEGRDNGLLQAWEIFEGLRLDADLVVLSACESGLGKEMGGEGLIGLTRAFQYAGARSVMASLWKISDRTTAELMVRFYRHLKDGKPKDEALRAAQVELLRGPIQVTNEKGEVEAIDASAPYFWAAFQIYGDWR